MQTQLELKHDYRETRYIVECGEEHENMLANFIAAVSTGAIKVSFIDSCYPDSDLFKDSDEKSYSHTYEELRETNPSFRTVQPLQAKSELLLKLEKNAKAAPAKEAA